MSLARFLERRAARSPRALALADPAMDFAELEARVAAAARCLGAAGVGIGDSLALALGNGVPFVVALHAAARVGARVALLNTRLTAAELAPQLRQVAPGLVMHDEALSDVLATACAEAGGVARLVPRPGCPFCGGDPLHAGAPLGGPVRALRASEPFAVLFTSGTTDRAKAVPLSPGNLAWGAHASALRLGDRGGDRWLATLPLFHVGGLALLVRSLVQGSAVELAERFDPERLDAALDRDRITLLPLVPTMLSRLLAVRGARRAPASLRVVLLGGAAADPALVERARALGFPVRPTYGMTEAASQIATAAASDGGVGQPLFGTRLRIVNAAGRVQPAGSEGEIELRGPTLMAGYLAPADGADENCGAFRDGWLRSGDFGHLDAAGKLHVHGRRQDRIVTGGENVSPLEVEAVLLAHPEVAEAGVAGVPDDDLGAQVTAWVVAGPGRTPTAAALRGFCRERLAGYKVPKQVRFVAALPRTAAGKLQRGRLADQSPWSSESLSRQPARSALASARVKPSSSAME